MKKIKLNASKLRNIRTSMILADVEKMGANRYKVWSKILKVVGKTYNVIGFIYIQAKICFAVVSLFDEDNKQITNLYSKQWRDKYDALDDVKYAEVNLK